MKWLVIVVIVLAGVFFFSRQKSDDFLRTTTDGHEPVEIERVTPPPAASAPSAPEPPKNASTSPAQALDRFNAQRANSEGAASPPDDTSLTPTPTRDYVVEDGVAVIEGDIVIGLPGSAGRVAQIPKITPWPTHEIPVFIQPSVVLPPRIAEALGYFGATAIKFVPYTNQRDVLVFENASKGCKSYMGKIGGKQPIFIAPNCGAHEIAHEVMHALGFIHEQNRSDRDSAIVVNRDNILGTALVNFEKFPSDYMTLSGLSPFDFTSLMLYPPSMFSRNGDPTISSATGTPIQPSEQLSENDIARINAYYGSR